MVKSPDLLNKEVSRGDLLKFAGIGLGILAAGACAEKTSSAKPASPSIANIPRETADARPTPPPTQEATPTPEAVEQKPLPNPEQIVSREKMEKLFTLPNWKDTKASAGGEKAAADAIATYMTDVVNGILNPLNFVDEENIEELGLGQRIQDKKLDQFREDLQGYVMRQFSELAVVDDTQGSIPESLKQLETKGENNTLVALTQCSQPESLTDKGRLFSRTVKRQVNTNGQKVLYFTNSPTQPHKIRIETTFDMTDNLEPKSDSAVCQKVDQDLQKGSESKHFVFDFTPPEEEGPMKLVDFRIKKSVTEP